MDPDNLSPSRRESVQGSRPPPRRRRGRPRSPTPPGKPTLLLVDDAPDMLHALQQLLHHDAWRVLSAASGPAAMALLDSEAVDVILCDQRIPGMPGADFLREARRVQPDAVRVVLSGETGLDAVTDAINEGAIYKFLCKPCDDRLLCATLQEAFARKAVADEQRRMVAALRHANQRLEGENARLLETHRQQLRQLERMADSLSFLRSGLDHLPIAVVGLDHRAEVVLVNAAAQASPALPAMAVGLPLPAVLQDVLAPFLPRQLAGSEVLQMGKNLWQLDLRPLGEGAPRGMLLTLLPLTEIAAALDHDH